MAVCHMEQNFSCILFPFRFPAGKLKEEAFNAPVRKQNGKEARLWSPDRLGSYHMKENTALMLGVREAPGTIGQIYALADAVRRELDIPDARTEVFLHCRGRKEALPLRLGQIRLVLFHTGIGFLELGVTCCSQRPEDLLDLNYFLCEVKGGQNELCYHKRTGKDTSEEIRFHCLDLVRKLTASLGEVDDFDTDPGLRYVNNKPLAFTFLLMDRMPEDVGRMMFNLRTNFKASYQAPQEQYDLRTARNIFHPFENIYWGVSLNAVVCCAALSGVPGTDHFFRTTFPNNLRESYLYLYLLRLHQRYAIQDFQRQFAYISAGEREQEQIYDAYAKASALRERCAVFKLQCMFREPASVEHINEYDRFLAENLQIHESFSDFEDGIRQMEALLNGYREKIDAERAAVRRKQELRKERTLYLVTALWSCVVFLESAWELAENLLNRDITFHSSWILLPLSITALPVLQLVLELRQKNRQIRRDKTREE